MFIAYYFFTISNLALIYLTLFNSSLFIGFYKFT